MLGVVFERSPETFHLVRISVPQGGERLGVAEHGRELVPEARDELVAPPLHIFRVGHHRTAATTLPPRGDGTAITHEPSA
jgi:hypothetical protein